MSVKSEKLYRSPSNMSKQLSDPSVVNFIKISITKTECMTSKLQNSNHISDSVYFNHTYKNIYNRWQCIAYNCGHRLRYMYLWPLYKCATMGWIWLIKSAVATYDQMQWVRTKYKQKTRINWSEVKKKTQNICIILPSHCVVIFYGPQYSHRVSSVRAIKKLNTESKRSLGLPYYQHMWYSIL